MTPLTPLPPSGGQGRRTAPVRRSSRGWYRAEGGRRATPPARGIGDRGPSSYPVSVQSRRIRLSADPSILLHAFAHLHHPLHLPRPEIRGASPSRPRERLGPSNADEQHRLWRPVRTLPPVPQAYAGNGGDGLRGDHYGVMGDGEVDMRIDASGCRRNKAASAAGPSRGFSRGITSGMVRPLRFAQGDVRAAEPPSRLSPMLWASYIPH